jgi:quercetin dioxygenase-like cupin family protein
LSCIKEPAPDLCSDARRSSPEEENMPTPTMTETLKRTFMQRMDVPGGNFEAVFGMTDVAPNEPSGRQSHPGAEAGYVLEGSLTLVADGQPPLTLTAGQSWRLPAGAVHDVRGGAKGAKVIATWVVEKGKPFVSPAK